ncbi:MAG: type III pantothenate kinase [Thiobacillus sp.]
MKARHVYLDAGNTRLKWRLYDAHGIRHDGAAYYAELDALWPLCKTGMHAYLASVASAELTRSLTEGLLQRGVETTVMTVQQQAGGVTNGYSDPGQLGVDRWLALVGARQRTLSACLVVSAGTALTVDAMAASGDFLGGVIVPGMALMQQALQTGTARVQVENGAWQRFPTNTPNAVHTGVITALAGTVLTQYTALAQISATHPLCMVTGGDADLLLPYLTTIPVEQCTIVPHLILEGIEYLVGECRE